jgi:hypothetical protein
VKSLARPWIGGGALVLGVSGVVASIGVTSTPAGEGLTFGFAAFIAFFGLLSLLVRNPTPDHGGLFVSGINENASSTTKAGAMARWIGRAALVVGLVTVVLGATVARSSPVAVAVTVGLGAFTAVIGLWSLLAIDPTRDYLTLAVVGLALFLAPWIAGFVGDDAAWAAWVPGFVTTALGAAGYLRGESLDFATTVRTESDARYRERFG